MGKLKGKTAVITGAAAGFGRAVALKFAAEAANLVLVDLNEAGLKETLKMVREENKQVKTIEIVADVSEETAVKGFIQDAVSNFGSLDVVFNNAGVAGNLVDIADADFESFKRNIAVNLHSVFLGMKYALGYMKDHGGGSIVNTASMSSYIVNVPQTISAYNTSKAGCKHLTKSCAVEWAKYNIRVNSVSPGYMMTELTRRISHMHKHWLPLIPQGRIGDPADLVGAFVYLISDASSYATGTDIVVDGGYTCL
jgi:NAD(P)-dependent dehydrogenase (short-subunit alcohol dehydrogenase family)